MKVAQWGRNARTRSSGTCGLAAARGERQNQAIALTGAGTGVVPPREDRTDPRRRLPTSSASGRRATRGAKKKEVEEHPHSRSTKHRCSESQARRQEAKGPRELEPYGSDERSIQRTQIK